MAKAPTPAARVAIVERGAALLALIAASTVPAEGVMYLTQDEASDAINAGHAVVDTNDVKDNTAAVSLTDAGRAALATVGGEGEAAVSNGTATGGRYEIEDYVPANLANKPTRGRGGGYPFDALNVNQSFHVPFDASKGEDTAARLGSTISGARAKYAVADGDKTEDVTVKTYKKGDDGKFVKDADGKRVVDTTETVNRPVMKVVRDFKAVNVGDEDPKGKGARVVRIA